MPENVYGVADGLILRLEQSRDAIIEEMFFNGWANDHSVSNVFEPSVVVILCVLNAPRTMHDSSIT